MTVKPSNFENYPRFAKMGAMFTQKDVAEYYNNTHIHYVKWWNLRKSHSLHYGIWDKGTKNFAESLVNTNKTLMELAGIKDSDKILDAGCGVGGAALYLAGTKGVQVTGITLSQKQLDYANHLVSENNLSEKASFHIMDYTQTSFADESFDVVWACESVSSAPDKLAFIKEAHRVLKKGGRLIMSDFFISNEQQTDKHSWVEKWGKTWGINEFVSGQFFEDGLKKQGFTVKANLDYTAKIKRSAWRMYILAILATIPSESYDFFFPKVSRFAKKHYQCGYFQYKALKAGLWKYQIFLAIK